MSFLPWAFSILLIVPTLLEAAPDPVIVTINTKKVAHVVDEHFVSLTVNPTELLLGRPVGIGLNTAAKMMHSLSPAYVRLGGPDTSHYVFQTQGSPNHVAQSSEEFIITEDHWKDLNAVMERAKLDVIACINSGTRNTDNSKWDPRNAFDLISFSDKQQINVTWELGYELSEDGLISGQQAGKDITELRSVLNAFPRYQSSRLIGPDVRSLHGKEAAEHVLNMLVEASPALDAITWHPRWPQAGAIIPTDSAEDGYGFPPDFLEWDKQQLSKVLQRTYLKKPLWISEPQGENTGSFAEGLIMARRLALAAKLGIDVVMKQPNLNDITHPNPEYWVAVIHKKTLGRTILDSRALANVTDVTVVTHCTSPLYPHRQNGGITIFAINTGSSPHRTVIRGVAPSKHADEKVHQYILTAGGDKESIFSHLTYLNGEPLILDNNGELPEFVPRLKNVRSQLLLKLPPYSISYWVIPQAQVPLCQQKPFLEDQNVANDLNTVQKGSQNIRKINHFTANHVISPTLAMEQLKIGSVENDQKETTGTFERKVRDVNLEMLGKEIKNEMDDINDMMRTEVLGYSRNKEQRGEGSDDRLRATEEKINGIANDLQNFLGKADQENEFGKFLELSGLKQDFGKLMVDERLSRGKRKLSDGITSESKVLKSTRQKREIITDSLLAENQREGNGPAFKLDNHKYLHSNSLPNSGIDKVNNELQEELLLREIAFLEKTEETLIDTINSHKKKHEFLDKKLRDELASIKEEKLATLLGMKYSGQNFPERDFSYDINRVGPTYNKKLDGMKWEISHQYPKKRETSINDDNIGGHAADEKNHKVTDHLKALKTLLNKRKENAGKSGYKTAEIVADTLKDFKEHREPGTQVAASTTTSLPIVSATTRKLTYKERQRSRIIPKNDNFPLVEVNAMNSTNEDGVTTLEESKRKTRNLLGVSNVEPSGEVSQLHLEKDSTPNKQSLKKIESNEENTTSIISEEQVSAESREDSSSSGSGESGEGGTINSESNASPNHQHGSSLPVRQGNNFQLFKDAIRGIKTNSGETEKSTASYSLGAETHNIQKDINPPRQVAKLTQPTTELSRSSVTELHEITETPQSFEITESTQTLYSQTSTPPFTQTATSGPYTEVASSGKERSRRNTQLSPGVSRSDATSNAENDGHGGSTYQNTLTKRKISKSDNKVNKPGVLGVAVAGSGVNIVLDDVIPETYDQTVVKLEHLVLPEYLKNIANVVDELKIVANIFKGIGGAAIGSLGGSSSDHVQKIDRTKRDATEIEKHLSEQEAKELMANIDDSHEKNQSSYGSDQLDGNYPTGIPKDLDNVHANDAEALLSENIVHKVISDAGEDLKEPLLNTSSQGRILSQSLNSTSLETSTDRPSINESVTSSNFEVIENVTHNLPLKGTPGSKLKKSQNSIQGGVKDDDDGLESPWLASTHNIIEQVIKNLIKKQEELQARRGKGKREISNPGYKLLSPANFKLQPGKPLIPMPQTESINQFMSQLRPGVYVVPSKDMTNVHADQVDSQTKATGPSVMTLNIYYDKKKENGGDTAERAPDYITAPNVRGPPKHAGWPNSGIYKTPYSGQSIQEQSPISSPHPLLPIPQTAPLVSSRRAYESHYSMPNNPIQYGAVHPYQPSPYPSVQHNYDKSYTLVGHEPRKDSEASFMPWGQKENPASGDTNDLNWDPEIEREVQRSKPPNSSEQFESKQESDRAGWYMRKTMNEPPVYIKKEIPRTTKKSQPRASRPNLTDNAKMRSIEPYWNRTIKEIFKETSNEPFWNFLKSPEQSYSSYKSGEDGLDDYVSREEKNKGGENTSTEKDLQNLRRKRSLLASTTLKKVKRSASYMTNNIPSNSLIDNFDTKPFDEAWAKSRKFVENSVPDYYFSGRILNFNGIPSRHNKEDSLFTNQVYKITPRQRVPLDTSRVSHGILSKDIFKKSPVADWFDLGYHLKENAAVEDGKPSDFTLNGSPSLLINSEPNNSQLDESALRQFYKFAIQLFKSITEYN